MPFSKISKRLDKSSNPMGNGVGLSICKQICLQLEGDIIVHSIPEVGSTFTFQMIVFPVTQESRKKQRVKQVKNRTQETLQIVEEVLPTINEV